MPPSVLRVLLCVKVNPDGGLLSKGHPIGATGAVAGGPSPRALRPLPSIVAEPSERSTRAVRAGLIQCYELVVQLRRRAGARQVHHRHRHCWNQRLRCMSFVAVRTAESALRSGRLRLGLGSWGRSDLRPARAPASAKQVREAAVALQHNFGIGSTCVVTVDRGPSRPSPSRL